MWGWYLVVVTILDCLPFFVKSCLSACVRNLNNSDIGLGTMIRVTWVSTPNKETLNDTKTSVKVQQTGAFLVAWYEPSKPSCDLWTYQHTHSMGFHLQRVPTTKWRWLLYILNPNHMKNERHVAWSYTNVEPNMWSHFRCQEVGMNWLQQVYFIRVRTL